MVRCYVLDQNGVLDVSVIGETSKTRCYIKITNEKGAGRMLPEELKKLLGEEIAFAEADARFRQTKDNS